MPPPVGATRCCCEACRRPQALKALAGWALLRFTLSAAEASEEEEREEPAPGQRLVCKRSLGRQPASPSRASGVATGEPSKRARVAGGRGSWEQPRAAAPRMGTPVTPLVPWVPSARCSQAIPLRVPLRAQVRKEVHAGVQPVACGAVPAGPTRPGWQELPAEILQAFADFLPTFAGRRRFCGACKAFRRVEWRLAAPRHLDEELSGIGLSDLGARAVAVALARPEVEDDEGFQELHLGSNRIADAGAEALAGALSRPGCRLRRLCLAENEIGEGGARALAEALASNSVLEELDLWGNCLTDAGRKTIISAARCEVFLLRGTLPRRRALLRMPSDAKTHALLFDWVSKVHAGLESLEAAGGAPPDSEGALFRTFWYMDAYMSGKAPLAPPKLQLLAVASTLAARRHQWQPEERRAEELELAAWLAMVTGDDECTPDGVIQASQKVRQVLGLQAHQPTVHTFLKRFLRVTRWTDEMFSLASYLMELAVIHSFSLDFRPQVIAAAAVVLSHLHASRELPDRGASWRTELFRYGHIDVQQELAPCTTAMALLHASKQPDGGLLVNQKYSQARFHTVGWILPRPACDAAFLAKYLAMGQAP